MKFVYNNLDTKKGSLKQWGIITVLAIFIMSSMSSCLSPPTNLNVTNITATSARFNFTPNGTTGYYYSTSLLTPPAPMGTTTGNYKDFVSLTPNTHYYAYARAEANLFSNASNWVHTDFTTLPLLTATISGGGVVCQGQSSLVVFTGSGGTRPYTFTYKINNGPNQTVTSSSISDTAQVHVSTATPGTYTYTLISVEDGNNVTNAQSGSVTITVNGMPTATISGSDTVCVNDPSPQITFTGSGGVAPYTFTYKRNGGTPQTITSTGNVATITISTSSPSENTYELVSVSDNNCAQSQTGTASVKVNPIPNATISGSTEVCQNTTPDPMILFTGSGGTPPYTFTYKINNGPNQTITTSTGDTAQVFAPTNVSGTFTYTLISVTDNLTRACTRNINQTAVVQVNELPSATISGADTVCVGAPSPHITFTGSGGTAPYTFSYKLNGGSTQTITSTGNTATISISTATPGIYTYELLSVADNSATHCYQNQSGMATVKVNPLPTATISGGDTVCQDEPNPVITFTGSNGTLLPYTFTYKINGGAPQTVTSTGNTATVSAPTNTPGTYEYTLVSVAESSAGACSSSQSGSVTVKVNPLPAAYIAESDTISVCEDDASPIITFVGGNSSAPYTFFYKVNNGSGQTITSTGDTAIIQVPTNTPGTFTYTLYSVQDNSNTFCLHAQYDTVTFVINPNPTATISISDTEVCQNATLYPQVTFTGANGTAPYTFTYTVNGGNSQTIVSNGDTATLQVSTLTDSTYHYTLVSVQDASSAACLNLQNGEVSVTIDTLPMVNLGSDTALCEGTKFNITLDAQNPGSSYSWSTGDTTQTIQIDSGGHYSVVVIDGNGCVGDDDYRVTIIPYPVVDLGNDTTICEGSFVTLDAGSQPPTTTFLWNTGATAQSIDAYHPGRFKVVADNLGCAVSDSIYLTVIRYVKVISISALDRADGRYQMEGWGIESADNYLWDFGDGTTSTDSSPLHQYEATGNYWVTLKVSNDCGIDSTGIMVHYITTGITSNNTNSDVKLFPNPAKNKIIIQAGGTLKMKHVMVYNVLGQKVFDENTSNPDKYILNVSTYASGMYHIRLKMEDGRWITRHFEKAK